MNNPKATLLAASLYLIMVVPCSALAYDADDVRERRSTGVSQVSAADTVEDLRSKVNYLEQRINEIEHKERQNFGSTEQTVQEDEPLRSTGGGPLPEGALQLYGQARISADGKAGDWSKAGMNKGGTLVSNASRIGVRGTLPTPYGDTSAIYQLEFQFEGTNRDTTPVFFRDGFVGLEGGWGRFRAGRLTVPYKTTLEEVDPWIDSFALQSHERGQQGSSELHANFFNNSVDYISPEIIEGLTVGGFFASSLTNSTTAPLHNTGTLKNYVGGQAGGAGFKFYRGAFYVGADFIFMEADNTTLARLTNGHGWQVAARYAVGPMSVGAFYEDVEDLGLGRNFYVNSIYTHNDTRFIVTYSINEAQKVYLGKARNFNVGVKHWVTDYMEVQTGFQRQVIDTSPSNITLDLYTLGMNLLF